MQPEDRKIVLKKDIIDGIKNVGIVNGDTVMVHTSLSSMGFVCGGPQVVIEALLEVAGADGTIMMPTQSWKNLDPEAGVHWEEPKNWPAYDKKITPTNTMGAVAEMFRNWPGAFRSNHPARSVAAVGKNAEYLTKDHDLSNIFGIGSPIDKLYQLNGKVLLIGVGYDKNTSIHLADAIASYPSKHNTKEGSAIMVEGKREWVTYETLYVDGEDFEEIGMAFEKSHKVIESSIGNTVIKSMSQKELVGFAIKWIETNRK